MAAGGGRVAGRHRPRAGEIDGLAGDPPLTLFLMLEAEADTGGRTLGALGSVLMGETLAAALPAVERDAELDAARAWSSGPRARRRWPSSSASSSATTASRKAPACIRPSDDAPPGRAASQSIPGGTAMLDIQVTAKPPIPRIEVADYIEMGRLVAAVGDRPGHPAGRRRRAAPRSSTASRWSPTGSRPSSSCRAPSTTSSCACRCKEMIEESLERMTDPMGDGSYPLPQFYADHYRPGFGPVMTPLDTLLARIADYTIAQCR